MAYDDPTSRPLIDAWARRNLAGDESNIWLDPDGQYAPLADSRDVAWWLRATKALRGALGADDRARALLADRLFVLEAYPYPMRTNPRRRLPTHTYTAELLTAWLASGRLVVIGRGERDWAELVPALPDAISAGQAPPRSERSGGHDQPRQPGQRRSGLRRNRSGAVRIARHPTDHARVLERRVDDAPGGVRYRRDADVWSHDRSARRPGAWIHQTDTSTRARALRHAGLLRPTSLRGRPSWLAPS